MEELSELSAILESLLQDTKDFKELLDPKPVKSIVKSTSCSSLGGTRVCLLVRGRLTEEACVCVCVLCVLCVLCLCVLCLCVYVCAVVFLCQGCVSSTV